MLCSCGLFRPSRADVAQLVEQLIRNQQVTRSSRVVGSIQNQLLTAIGTRRLIVLGCAWDADWFRVQTIDRP